MLIVRLVSADVMYKLGAHTVLANDVGAQDEQNFYNFGDTLSGRTPRISSPLHRVDRLQVGGFYTNAGTFGRPP